ncbi:MAG: hypothetical protein A2138_22975 [Deltaproteobacteria bacterium RBG_16_71_12]|nr:MAG: hypothetical protein A2138_22975 [Deltaproteobacteria bacterium RBG_16_71_12]
MWSTPGAGDGSKTRVLLEHLLTSGRAVRYVPIDISEGAMRGFLDALLRVGDEARQCRHDDRQDVGAGQLRKRASRRSWSSTRS